MSADNPVTLSSDIESTEGGDARSSDDALVGLTQVSFNIKYMYCKTPMMASPKSDAVLMISWCCCSISLVCPPL